MDGSPFVDIKLLLTLGGVAVSVVAAGAVAKNKIAILSDSLKEVEKRLRESDSRTDKIENAQSTMDRTVHTLSGMMSPKVMDENSRLSEKHSVKLILNGCRLTMPIDTSKIFWTQEDLINQERELDYDRNFLKTE